MDLFEPVWLIFLVSLDHEHQFCRFFFSKYTSLNKAECTFSAWFIQYILLMLEPTRNKIKEKSIFFVPMKDSYAGQIILFLAANVRISSSRSKTNQNQVKDQDKEASIDVSLVLISEIFVS